MSRRRMLAGRMRSAGRCASEVVLIAAIAVASPRGAAADAAKPTATLAYEVDAGLQACPTEAVLRAAIAARLGYDPVRPDGEVRVRAHIGRDGARLVARVQAFDAAGASLGERTLDSPAGDCAELGRALALAVSVAIDPFVLTRGSTTSDEPATIDAGDARVDASAQPPPAVVVPSVWRGSSVFAAIGGAIGAVPASRPELALGGEARRGWLGARLAVSFDLPATEAGASGGEVSAFRTGVRIAGCAHRGRWSACVGVAGDALHGRGIAVDHPQAGTAWTVAATGDVGIRLWAAGRVAVTAAAGVDGSIRGATLEVNLEPVFTTPRASPWVVLAVTVALL